jgi:uncharacterized repeat protein (TIGR03803 family)
MIRKFGLPALALGLALAATSAQAGRPFHVLATFKGENGAMPMAELTRDAAGNIYGTTMIGGPVERGTVFKLAPDGTQTLLATFALKGGSLPRSPLLRDAQGNLFGTTSHSINNRVGGSLFEITADGRQIVHHHFSKSDPLGTAAMGALAQDAAGNIYGTTDLSVFKLAPNGKVTMFSFFGTDGLGNGMEPEGGVTIDAQGNLYGATARGGSFGWGTVYKIAPDGTRTVLHSFDPSTEGYAPDGGVVRDARGALYGTTFQGGYYTYGTVYKLAPDGTFTTLHTFDSTDGQNPIGTLAISAEGNLYGTTSNDGIWHAGTVFEVTREGRFYTVHQFDLIGPKSVHNGIQPQAGVVLDGAGNLYGTTTTGGGAFSDFQHGTLFKIGNR